MQLSMDLNISLLIRLVQFASALIALTTLCVGFEVHTKTWTNGQGTYHMMAATPTTQFVFLLTYTSMLYSLWYAVAVEISFFAVRPSYQVHLALDATFLVCYLIASVAFSASPFVVHCNQVHEHQQCGAVVTSVVFCYLTLATFCGSLVWTVIQKRNQMSTSTIANAQRSQATYHAQY